MFSINPLNLHTLVKKLWSNYRNFFKKKHTFFEKNLCNSKTIDKIVNFFENIDAARREEFFSTNPLNFHTLVKKLWSNYRNFFKKNTLFLKKTYVTQKKLKDFEFFVWKDGA